MQNITIGRYPDDPEAQACIRPDDGSWQVVIDKAGAPHFFVRCPVELDDCSPGTGLVNLDDMLVGGLTVPELMASTFGGRLAPDEEDEAAAECAARAAAKGIPCPRA